MLAVIPLFFSLGFPLNVMFLLMVLANTVVAAGLFAILDNIDFQFLGN
jgi:hypothetical protein